jgi:hypothetical protein
MIPDLGQMLVPILTYRLGVWESEEILQVDYVVVGSAAYVISRSGMRDDRRCDDMTTMTAYEVVHQSRSNVLCFGEVHSRTRLLRACR